MPQEPYAFFEYTAQAGDTFLGLARRFEVSERLLRLHNRSLREGCTVRIPQVFGGCGRGFFYAIRRGETLYRIARRFLLPLPALLEANPYLNPSYYLPGQIIVIPQAVQPMRTTYRIGEGEGLLDVLRRFGMDITAFCRLNPDIDPLSAAPGQRINVPQRDETGGGWYTLQPGDTLVSVAQRLGVQVSALLGANVHLRPGQFMPGVRIRVPDMPRGS